MSESRVSESPALTTIPCRSFQKVHVFVEKQRDRHFMERLLNRDKIRIGLEDCDKALNDTLGMFNVRRSNYSLGAEPTINLYVNTQATVTIRILKQVLPQQGQNSEFRTSSGHIRRAGHDRLIDD